MLLIDKIKSSISNSSIKKNLLNLYSIIIIIMSCLIATMLFYSFDLNRSYNKVMINFENYNRIYSQVNSIVKDIYSNITEQKTFEKEYYENTIKDIQNELQEISDNFEEIKNNESVGTVSILERTIDSFKNEITEIGLLIQSNSNYASRENQLNKIIHIKEIFKDNVQNLMELNLTLSQKHINTIRSCYNIALIIIIILFFAAIILSVCFLLWVSKDTVDKINIVSDNANRLANGDLSIEPINFSDSHEFQILALSFNKMKNNIKDYINQLSSSEMRISSILNALNDCIITTNSLGEIESYNIATKKIFGYKKNEIIGHNINEIINTIDFNRYREDMFNAQKLIKDVKIIDNKYQLEGLKKDGTIIPIEVSYNEVEVEDQKVTTFVVHDITQHKAVEKMKDEFISVLSHELRTPLTSIKGTIGLASSGVLGVLPDKVSDILKIADNNCNRLADLINDILDLEKIKAGKMSFDFNNYAIDSIVNEALESSTSYAKQYNVEYTMANSVGSAIVNVDKNRLIQALLNLLSNASKFSHPNSTVDIEITRINNSTIRVNIKDKGIGIPEEFQPQIYNTFSQADSSDTRKKGGTGLGLSITKEILNMMHCKINFESKINEGTNFYIDIPSKYESSIN